MAQVAYVLLNDIPVWSILAQGRAELRLVLHGGSVAEAGHLEAERLATATCA